MKQTGTNRVRWIGNLPGIVCSFGLLIGLAALTQAAIIYVPLGQPTIQAAVNAANPGDTIVVAAGTYRERVVLTKAVTITGDRGDVMVAGPGPNAPILDGDLNADGVADKGDGFTIPKNTSLSGITIEGFIIQNFGNGGGGNGVGCGIISYENASANVTIRDNLFRNLGYNGIYVGTDKDQIQSHWLIQRNIVIRAPYAGIELTDVRNSQVLYNEITGPAVIFDDPGDAGVGIEIAARARMGQVASTNITVKGNTVAGAFASGSRTGINILSRAYNSGSTEAILSGITVEGNTVSGSGTRGIDVVAESRNSKPSLIKNLAITHNTLAGNAAGIEIGLADGSPHADGTYDIATITMEDNNLEGNTVIGIANLTEAIIDARNNWWGSDSGPGTVGSGSGDKVSINVTYTPWLANRPGRPDFSIASIRFVPAVLTPGCSFSAYITATNSGAAEGNAGTLTIWVDRYAWAMNSDGDQSQSIGTLAAGESKELTFAGLTAPSRTDGTYHFRAFVDSANDTCYELDEENNQKVEPYKYSSINFVDKPDFAITAASGDIVPWAPAPVGKIVGSITVANTGTAAGNAGRLTYWADWRWDFAGLAKQPNGNIGGNVGILQPGESRTYDITGLMPAASYGTHTLVFFLDSDQATDEYSEWNNLLVFTYEFTGNPSNYKEIPNFAITNIMLTPANPAPGQLFDADVDIVNAGSAAGDAGNLSVWVSRSEAALNSIGADQARMDIGMLAAGAVQTVHFTGLTAPAITSGGTHHFRAFIDSANETAETSECDNQLTTCYFFSTQYGDKPDLSIIDLSVNPSPLTPNCAFTATITVMNSGSAASAAACNLTVWADHVAMADDNEIGDATAAIGPLNPGQVTTVTIPGLTTPAIGWLHTIRAFVDSGNVINEQSEGNNQLTLSYEYVH